MPKTEVTNKQLILTVLHIPGQENIVHGATRLLKATPVRGYNVFLPQVACKNRRHKLTVVFLSVLYILGQEKYYSRRTRLIQTGDYKLML